MQQNGARMSLGRGDLVGSECARQYVTSFFALVIRDDQHRRRILPQLNVEDRPGICKKWCRTCYTNDSKKKTAAKKRTEAESARKVELAKEEYRIICLIRTTTIQ